MWKIGTRIIHEKEGNLKEHAFRKQVRNRRKKNKVAKQSRRRNKK